MKFFYPFASGSLYTASYAVSSSYAIESQFINYVLTATTASSVINQVSGSRGAGVCLLTTEQYLLLSSNGDFEICDFEDEDDISGLLV
jgi:hypothetical protein